MILIWELLKIELTYLQSGPYQVQSGPNLILIWPQSDLNLVPILSQFGHNLITIWSRSGCSTWQQSVYVDTHTSTTWPGHVSTTFVSYELCAGHSLWTLLMLWWEPWCIVGLTTVTVFWPVSQSTVSTNFNRQTSIGASCFCSTCTMSTRLVECRCTHPSTTALAAIPGKSAVQAVHSCLQMPPSTGTNVLEWTVHAGFHVSTLPGRSHLHSAAIGDLLVPPTRTKTIKQLVRMDFSHLVHPRGTSCLLTWRMEHSLWTVSRKNSKLFFSCEVAENFRDGSAIRK